MPFEKGNTLWREGIKARKEKQDKLDYFLSILVNGGAEKYGDFMDKLANGEKLLIPEKEYMNRFEGWREYIRPKLAKTETKLASKGLSEILDAIDAENRGH